MDSLPRGLVVFFVAVFLSVTFKYLPKRPFPLARFWVFFFVLKVLLSPSEGLLWVRQFLRAVLLFSRSLPRCLPCFPSLVVMQALCRSSVYSLVVSGLDHEFPSDSAIDRFLRLVYFPPRPVFQPPTLLPPPVGILVRRDFLFL